MNKYNLIIEIRECGTGRLVKELPYTEEEFAKQVWATLHNNYAVGLVVSRQTQIPFENGND